MVVAVLVEAPVVVAVLQVAGEIKADKEVVFVMPELPEVETIRRGLEEKVCVKTIHGVGLISPALIKYPKPEEFMQQISGAKVLKANRHGKYLILTLSNGLELVMHLKLTGRLLYRDASEPMEPYAHVVFFLDGDKHLRFVDVRKLGEIYLVPQGDYSRLRGLSAMGVEPLTEGFSEEVFRDILKKRAGKIKSVLMDQAIIAGIGNAYSDEALFLAKIHPERPCKSLGNRELKTLYDAIRDVLRTALTKGGERTDEFVNIEGKPGGYEMIVHGLEGKKCQNCGQPIMRRTIGGRSAFFCVNCQRI